MQRKSLIKGLGVDTKQQDLNLITKLTTNKPAPKVMRGNNVMNIIEEIKIKVEKYLGKYRNRVKSCRDEQELINYVDKIIENKRAGLDTETTGLDCLNDDVVGTCLYTPGEKAIYIPHKHKSYVTGQYLQNQISYEFMQTQLQRLKDAGVKIIYHNAKFDIRMVKHKMGVWLDAYWDTMLAAKLLNNNEEANLKYQYSTHVAKEEKTYDFKKLFDSVEYAMVPIETATLYAATDPLITYELQQWQEKEFEKYPGIYKVFMDIEMPVLQVVVDMEDNGISLDMNRAQELSVKYHKLMDEAQKEVDKEIAKYKSSIMMYMSKFPAAKIQYPVNVASPTQLAILLYDILRCEVVDKKKPRGTGEEILEKLNLPLCKLILKHRGLSKLLSTYIDKLPQTVDKNTKRIHASFNQIGADTGRFSSSEPNLQNIPSHNQEIRTMFTASDDERSVKMINDYFVVDSVDEVLTDCGWKFVKHLNIGDKLCVDDTTVSIVNIIIDESKYFLYVS